jgi:hypothetical protein
MHRCDYWPSAPGRKAALANGHSPLGDGGIELTGNKSLKDSRHTLSPATFLETVQKAHSTQEELLARERR